MDDLFSDPYLQSAPEFQGYRVLGPCILHTKLGEGGMGAVYLGLHARLSTDVAVKCLLPKLAGRSRLVERFWREAQLAALVRHPNLIHVYDVDSLQADGLHYLIMEYVDGETARQRGTSTFGGPCLTPAEAVAIVLQAARGLAAAHAKGIVHRDVKPDNILIGRDGQVKVADLGLGSLKKGHKALEITGEITLAEERSGSPRYMPPEQWRGLAGVGPPGDVWALGATLYFLLAGTDALDAENILEIHRRVAEEPFPDLEEKAPGVPRELAAVLRRATERDPARRFRDASEVVAALEDVVARERLDCDLASGASEYTPIFEESRRPSREVIAQYRERLKVQTSPPPGATVPPRPDRPAEHATETERGPIESPRSPAPLQGRIERVRATGTAVKAPARPARRWIQFGAALFLFLAVAALGVWTYMEAQPLELRITRPEPGSWVPSSFTLEGSVASPFQATVRAGGRELRPAGEGRERRWSVVCSLEEGPQRLAIEARDAWGRTVRKELLLRVDSSEPELRVRVRGADADGLVPAGEAAARLAIEAIDGGEIEAVLAGGVPLELRDGAYLHEVPFVGAGERTVTVLARDRAGNTAERQVTVRRRAPADSMEREEPSPEPVLPPEPAPPPEISGFEKLERNRAGYFEYEHVESGIRMVLVPGGRFIMGSDMLGDERPPHEVVLDDFLIAKYEVSQAIWEKVTGANPSLLFRAPELPVQNVSWEESKAFCERLGLSLPTEAQWEYACRGGRDAPFGFGAELSSRQANFASDRPVPVGERGANDYGLHDMHGNVAEWSSDAYEEDFYEREEARARNPENRSASAAQRVARGGYYLSSSPSQCRCSARYARAADDRSPLVGLRPAKRLSGPLSPK